MRCISVERAYEFVDWRLLVLIGGMTAFGTAMDKTGAAGYLAGLVVQWFSPFGILAILAGFFVLTIVLTQPMSNAAAALVVLPVAISTAQQLGANERTFAIGIMLAASVSFITPFEPSCILVYGPGKYRFIDFVKVGLGLTVVLTIASCSLPAILLATPRASALIPRACECQASAAPDCDLHLNLNPRSFGMMIAFAASCSFITPLEPSCIMVYGAGRYRFADFLKSEPS